MNSPKMKLGCLFASIVILILLQSCSYKAIRLDEGASFDRTNRYALVVFGMRRDYEYGGAKYIHFWKHELETGSPDGSCLGGWDSVSVPLAPKHSNITTYMAFKVAPGSYIGGFFFGEPRELKAVSFTVESGQAYYVGDLVSYGYRLVKTEGSYPEAARWGESNLNLLVPLMDAQFKEYTGRRRFLLCWP